MPCEKGQRARRKRGAGAMSGKAQVQSWLQPPQLFRSADLCAAGEGNLHDLVLPQVGLGRRGRSNVVGLVSLKVGVGGGGEGG